MGMPPDTAALNVCLSAATLGYLPVDRLNSPLPARGPGKMTAVRAASLIILVAVMLAGCGTSQLRQHSTEQAVAKFVARHTGFRPTDVRCPPGISATVGTTFDCSFTGPDGRYVAHVRVTSVQGERVLFDVQTRRLAKSAR
jgi:hypothetical protein